jgi:hypothetical protein
MEYDNPATDYETVKRAPNTFIPAGQLSISSLTRT